MAIGVFWLGVFDDRKALSVQVLSQGTWFTGPLAPDFRLIYKDDPVQNVASVLIEIRNTGRQPIAASDFEKPLKLAIKGTSKILSVEQVGAEPSDLRLNLNSDGSDVHVGPTLFNPKDMALVSVTALCSGRPEIGVDLATARIAGIRSVDFQTSPKPRGRSFSLMTSIAALVSGLLANVISMLIFGKLGSFLKKHKKDVQRMEDAERKKVGSQIVQTAADDEDKPLA